MLIALTLALATALPPGTVLVGVSTIDGTSTELRALLPDGSARAVGVEEHAAGWLPKGAVGDGRLVLSVKADGAEGASVVFIDLESGARSVVGERAIPSQAPAIAEGDLAARFVRGAEDGSTFDVVLARSGEEEIVASTRAAWLTPVRGAAERYLEIGAGGDARLVDHALATVTRIGKARVRSPALVAGRLVVERALAGGRAEVVDVDSGRVLLRGLAGMDPLAAGEHLVVGAGTKRAGVIVGRVVEGALLAPRTLAIGAEVARAGTASPRAAIVDEGGARVVVWVDRGRALPGELWVVDEAARAAIRLLEPVAGLAVEVYGIVDARQAAP